MENILSDIFLKVVNMSITAAYVALAVIIIRLALKKAPKAVSYALWLVVLFRLVCPVSFSSMFSLMRLGTVTPSAQGSSVTYVEHPAAVYHAPADAAVTTAPQGAASDITPANASATNTIEILLYIAAAVWVAGVVVMLILSAVSHIRLKRRINDATLLYGNVYETDAIQSPFVLGVIRPRIYLPAGMSSAGLEYVLRHERMHIERRDNAIKPIAYAVLCLHWFNPLVWIAFYLMCCDMEMSCDERVLRGMEERDKACYSEALLKLSTNRRLLAGSPLAFGETPVKSRIKNVLKFKKPVFWIAAVAVVAAITAGICLIANPSGAASAGADSLYGNYKFDKQVYMNLLSSFLAFDGYEQYYTLEKDMLTITEASGDQRSFPITYHRKDVSEQDFNASFMFADDAENAIGKPDISQYKQRYEYTLCKPDGYTPGYRLYLMDDEVWLAELKYNEKLNGPNNEYIWSIYGIAKYGGELPKQKPAVLLDPAVAPSPTVDATEDPETAPSQTIGPEVSGDNVIVNLPLPGEVLLGSYVDGETIPGEIIKDEEQIKTINKAITAHSVSSTAWKATNISYLDHYISLMVNTGEEGNEYSVYYIFDMDGRHYIQNGPDGMYSYISESAYYTIAAIAQTFYESSRTADPSDTSAPAETETFLPRDVEISMYIGGDSDRDVTIKDEAQLQLVKDTVMDYQMNSADWEGVDVRTLDSYFVLSGQFTVFGDAGREWYCIFEIDGKHYMQSGARSRYTVIDDKTYKALLQVALGYTSSANMTVVSGDNSVHALEHQLWTQADGMNGEWPPLKPEQVAKYLQYLSIDPVSDGLTPFTPYLDGEKVYGTYKLYDSDFNEIPVIEPSGLEPQTYLFAYAPGPGKYIVELQASTEMSGIKFGNQYFFGVILPEKQ